jgi:DUF1365 family protein
MAINSSFISFAKVMHKRLVPRVNQFVYEVFYICFDIAKINNLSKKFFSLNKFNLFSFYNKDYGPKDGSSIENWAWNILKNQQIDQQIKKIFLFTHPRVLGYVFNPASFLFCLNEQEKLQAVIVQVNNTFGENHCYLIFNKDGAPIVENQWFEANKEFHVSPFFKIEGSYKFRFIFEQNKIAIWIDYFTNEKTLLTSVISKKQIDFGDLNLILAFIKIPFMTLKVIILIHIQALKIVFKKIKYIPKPEQKNSKITLTKN